MTSTSRKTLRPLRVGALLAAPVLAVLLACGPVPQRKCDTSTCTGCCDELGECLSGNALAACGSGGLTCESCPANQFCNHGACALFPDGDYDANFPDLPDAAFNRDAGVYDGGPSTIDSGTDAGRDAGTPDAGRDAGAPDSGRDAGVPDAGRDAGAPDSGRDAGSSDAGRDAGIDAGP